MKKIRPEKAVTAKGYTRWLPPIMRGYKMACCDCGLVHEMQFHAVEVLKEYADGRWVMKRLPLKKYRVIMRARRAERATAQQRAKRV